MRAILVTSAFFAMSFASERVRAEETDGATTMDGAATDGKKNERFYFARGEVQFRTTAVSDEDPANDRSMGLSASGGLRPFEGAEAFLALGVTQHFVAEPGESGTSFRDLHLGFDYAHDVDLGFVGMMGRALSCSHRVAAYLPTSRASVNQDLYLSPELESTVSFDPIEGVSLGLHAGVQYRWHRYAERVGKPGDSAAGQPPSGGSMLDRLLISPGGFIEWRAFDRDRWGSLLLGFDVGTTWAMKYASRETYVSDASSETMWRQDYGWSLYADYRTPVEMLSLRASLEHGARVLRDGIVNVNVFHRDETELAFAVVGKY